MTIESTKQRVEAAKRRVKDAEAELAQAEIEATTAAITPVALATLKSLNETSRMVWKICQLKNWNDGSKTLYKKARAFEDELALLLLGAGPRLEKLNELDPDRWKLEGESKMRPADYPTDEGVSHAIATWIFDLGFGRGSDTAYDELNSASRVQYDAYKAKAVEVFGAVGTRGFEFWPQGRHDT